MAKRFEDKPVFTAQITTDMGRLMPQAVDLEEAILGALMLEKDAYLLVADLIPSPDIFYKEQHKIVFEAIQSLFNEGNPVDILTVTQRLQRMLKLNDIGGPHFIAQLTSRVGSAANVQYHCAIVIEKFIRRNMIISSQQNMMDAYNEEIDTFELIDNAQSRILKPIEHVLNIKDTSAHPVFMDQIAYFEKIYSNDGKLLGVTSGFPDLDELTNGWQGPHHIVVAARPGMGKTAFGVVLARNAAVLSRIPVAFFSAEQGKEEIVKRIISLETGFPLPQLLSGKGIPKDIWGRFQKTASIYLDDDGRNLLHIEDGTPLTLERFRAQAHRLKNKYDIGLIVIDFLQKMTLSSTTLRKSATKAEEISFIANGIKDVAKELGIPIIDLAQLNRKVEDVPNRMPIMSHLKESGGIEESADMIFFLYRPEYYAKEKTNNPNQNHAFTTMFDLQGNEISSEGKLRLIHAKNRHGPLEDHIFEFDNSIAMPYQDGFKYDFLNWTEQEKGFIRNVQKEASWQSGNIFKQINKDNNSPGAIMPIVPPF